MLKLSRLTQILIANVIFRSKKIKMLKVDLEKSLKIVTIHLSYYKMTLLFKALKLLFEFYLNI